MLFSTGQEGIQTYEHHSRNYGCEIGTGFSLMH